MFDHFVRTNYRKTAHPKTGNGENKKHKSLKHASCIGHVHRRVGMYMNAKHSCIFTYSVYSNVIDENGIYQIYELFWQPNMYFDSFKFCILCIYILLICISRTYWTFVPFSLRHQFYVTGNIIDISLKMVSLCINMLADVLFVILAVIQLRQLARGKF